MQIQNMAANLIIFYIHILIVVTTEMIQILEFPQKL